MDVFESYQSLRGEGFDRGEILCRLKLRGFSIIAPIKAVRREDAVSLSEAKSIVEEHPSWAIEVEAAKPLQEGLQQAFLESENNS